MQFMMLRVSASKKHLDLTETAEIIGRTFTAKQNKIPSLPVIPPEVNGV